MISSLSSTATLKEQRFLEGRSSRAATTTTTRTSETHNKKRELEDRVRTRLAEWSKRLFDVHSEDVRATQLLLGQLQDELQTIRKDCFVSSTATVSATGAFGTVGNDEEEQTQEIAVVDLMNNKELEWLHTEFTKAQAQLDQQRKKLVPRAKFVFSKYRRAMAERKNTTDPVPSEPKPSVTTDSSVTNAKDAAAVPKQPDPQTVANMQDNSRLRLLPGGRVVVEQGGDENPRQIDPRFPVTLTFLRTCTVHIEAALPSVHFSNLYDCTLIVQGPIQTSLRVTACQSCDITIMSTLQQLRLHDSSNVTLALYQPLTGGVILEDCHDMIFKVPKQQHETLNIRDFNWLTTGEPSPNFSVQEENMILPVEEEQRGKAKVDGIPTQDAIQPTSSKVTKEDDEDTDDEL